MSEYNRLQIEYKEGAYMARDAKIIIRVPESVKDEFQKVAEEMGMTMSALGAYCVGQYLRQERSKVQVQDKMLESVLPMFKEQAIPDLDNPEVLKAITHTLSRLSEGHKQEQ